MSTDDASSSSTSRRLCRTRSESVRIFMPASTLREHAGTRTREPSTSTTHTRQTLIGVSVSRVQSVGVSTPRRRQASRIVVPSIACTSWPSTVTGSIFRGSPTNEGLAIEHLELDNRRLDRARGGLAQAADRRVAHRLRDVGEQGYVVGAMRRLALDEQPMQDLLLALRAHATRHALAARLVPEEPGDAQQDRLDVGGVVENDDRA